MIEQELQEKIKKGKVEFKEATPPEEELPEPKEEFSPDWEGWIPIMEKIKRLKKHRTSAPTHIPKNFFEQIEYVDDGTNRYVYFYINGSWRYMTLT